MQNEHQYTTISIISFLSSSVYIIGIQLNYRKSISFRALMIFSLKLEVLFYLFIIT